MSYMKDYLMDRQYELIDEAAAKSGFSADFIWDVIEAVSESPTSEGPLEDTIDICDIVKHGEIGAIVEYESKTGNVVGETMISDLYENYEYDSRDDMLCDIIYTIRELRRLQ